MVFCMYTSLYVYSWAFYWELVKPKNCDLVSKKRAIRKNDCQVYRKKLKSLSSCIMVGIIVVEWSWCSG